MKARIRYLTRVFRAYVAPRHSTQLTFWHERPDTTTGPPFYYMSFRDKASYEGPFHDGVPLLDYQGSLGRQFNPIAIGQYGLALLNVALAHGDGEAGINAESKERVGRIATWLVDNLEANQAGLHTWMHHFDWEYRDTLKAPWYSGLAQGQGVSLLVRVHKLTGEQKYLDAAHAAMESMFTTVDKGGVIYIDDEGDPWIEEYIVDPPTHILNGFMWALWGVWDYYLATGDERAKDLWDRCVITLKKNLHRYDLGWWSLYEQSGTRLKMIASPFYHRLHIVQLQVMEKLTGDALFGDYARRWDGYTESWFKRKRAFAQKVLFKIFYY